MFTSVMFILAQASELSLNLILTKTSRFVLQLSIVAPSLLPEVCIATMSRLDTRQCFCGLPTWAMAVVRMETIALAISLCFGWNSRRSIIY